MRDSPKPVFKRAATKRPKPALAQSKLNDQCSLEAIRDDIAPKIAADKAYQNAKENTPHTARMAPRPSAGQGDATTPQG